MLARHVPARADMHRQCVVAARSFHQHAKAGVREARAGVLGDGVDDLLIAARHQHLGDSLAQRLALGDGGEVLLALLVGVGDEVGVREPLGTAQHRARHLDIVVEGQDPHDGRRGVAHRRQPDCQLGACLGLDRDDELDDDLVE